MTSCCKGVGRMFRLCLWTRISGKVTACSSTASICCGVSCVVAAFRLMVVLIVATSPFVYEGGCVCSYTLSRNSLVSVSLTFALHSPFRRRTHSHDVKLPAISFEMYTYIQHVITFFYRSPYLWTPSFKLNARFSILAFMQVIQEYALFVIW